MTISRIQFPQKLWEESCTKPDFTGGLQSENHIKISLFNISKYLHYSAGRKRRLVSKFVQIGKHSRKPKLIPKSKWSFQICILVDPDAKAPLAVHSLWSLQIQIFYSFSKLTAVTDEIRTLRKLLSFYSFF